jgi:Cupredoxin-like domain
VNRAAAVLGLLLAVLLAGCGSSTGGDAGGSGKTDTIRVAVKDGKVTPATHREPVAKGDTVKLVVTTDTSDEVHVHGVDIEKETAPGKPVTITFVAKDAGIYEVETHDSGLQLLQLEVR